MKLQIMRKEVLENLKENLDYYIDKYQSSDNRWLYDEFKNPFIESKIEMQEFNLYIDLDNINKMELENVKRVYSNLMHLSDSHATDERVWAGLIHGYFYKDVISRWSSKREEKNMKKKSNILTRFFFGKSQEKYRNTMSKYWWIGKLTYDKNHENPFHLTEILANNDFATRCNDLFSCTYSRNFNILKAFLEVIEEFDKKQIVKFQYFRGLVQFLNLYGGVFLLDCLSDDEIKKVLRDKMEYYLAHGTDIRKSKSAKIALFDIVGLENIKTKQKGKVKVDETNKAVFVGKKKSQIVDFNGQEYKIKYIDSHLNIEE